MPNTSAAQGFLTPVGTQPAYDEALLLQLQPIIAGIAGFADPSLVRPRWQFPDVPILPEYPTDWCALGVSRTRSDTNVYEGHVDDADGFDSVQYTEEVDMLISCYGPNAMARTAQLRDGLKIAQNRYYLQQLGMDLLIIGEPVNIPALLTGQWVRRVDTTFTLRRYVNRSYQIFTVTGLSESTLDNEQYVTPIDPPAAP